MAAKLEEKQIVALIQEELDKLLPSILSHRDYFGMPNPKTVLATLIAHFNQASKKALELKVQVSEENIKNFLNVFSAAMANLASSLMEGIYKTIAGFLAQYISHLEKLRDSAPPILRGVLESARRKAEKAMKSSSPA